MSVTKFIVTDLVMLSLCSNPIHCTYSDFRGAMKGTKQQMSSASLGQHYEHQSSMIVVVFLPLDYIS